MHLQMQLLGSCFHCFILALSIVFLFLVLFLCETNCQLRFRFLGLLFRSTLRRRMVAFLVLLVVVLTVFDVFKDLFRFFSTEVGQRAPNGTDSSHFMRVRA